MGSAWKIWRHPKRYAGLLDSLSRDVDNLKEELCKKNESEENLAREKDDLVLAIDSLQSELTAIQSQNAFLTLENKALKSKFQNYSETEEKIAEIESMLSKVEDMKKRYEDRIHRLRTTIQTMKTASNPSEIEADEIIEINMKDGSNWTPGTANLRNPDENWLEELPE